MHPLMLGIEILTLVPNHLSTVKSTNPRPPYHTLNPQNHQKNTPKIKNHTRNGGEVKKRVAASGKKMKRSAGDHRRREKRGVEKVREVHIDTNP